MAPKKRAHPDRGIEEVVWREDRMRNMELMLHMLMQLMHGLLRLLEALLGPAALPPWIGAPITPAGPPPGPPGGPGGPGGGAGSGPGSSDGGTGYRPYYRARPPP